MDARRYLLTLIVVSGLIANLVPMPTLARPALAPDDDPPNQIVVENSLTGSPASEWDVIGAGDVSIQGFATDISVNRGGTIHFKIDTTAAAYEIRIYRLGYYGGNGARLIHTIPTADVTATDQPACTQTDIPMGGGATTNGKLLDCGNWSVSASWTVPADATSGVYIARPTRIDNGGASHIVFIVRDDASHSDLLFQTSDTTWQSYNPYGGYNAYGSSGATMAEKLSYNRPFTTRGAELENYLFNAEYPMIRWLEQNGYDVSYFSAIDTERHASLLTNHKVFLSVGHDEYWSQGRRDAVTAARDVGVHLAFFSGNEVYWKTRWEPSTADGNSTDYRTQVVYKEGSSAPSGSVEHRNCYNNYDCDPSAIWTGQWRETLYSGQPPENSLSGQISWRLNTASITVPGQYAPLRFWRNTDVANLAPNGQVTLAFGTLGYEWDPEYPQYADDYPDGRILLSTTDVTSFVGPEQHHLSLYRAPSGALVFGAGTVQWSWGLDENHDRETSTQDRNVQQATVNLLADMGAQPAMLQANLVAATASTDTTPPTVTVTSPASGSSVPGGMVTITGTASDVGGVVGVVEVSTNGGTTWRRASGRESWAYTYTAAEGTADIRVRAADDSANLSSPITHSFNVAPRTCPCSLWDLSHPAGPEDSDAHATEVGVKFRSDVDGWVTAVRFYKTAGNTGTHIGNLWDMSGNNLGSAIFTGETSSGWQEVTFDTPIRVTANTTYLASYFAPSGHYAATRDYFLTLGVDNTPLHALQNGVDGPNGVYIYSTNSAFPNQTWHSSNYWVDLVFVTEIGPDTTPPHVSSTTPVSHATGVALNSTVTATFNEAMDGTTITSSTFELRDAASNLIPATISYGSAARRATLTPTGLLAHLTVYTATVKGGTTGVADVAGNWLAADYVWSFTTAAPPPPPPDEGPGGPILVVSSAANPFGRYYAEILRTEGLNAFFATDISLVTPTTLTAYDVVILGEMPLTGAQVTMFSEWVNAGGNLVAMRPDAQLANLLGLTPTGTTLSEGYLLVNTASAPGAGIVNQTIQFHGTADRYSLSDATTVATLYADTDTPTSSPAVTVRNVGSQGGQAAAFAYDLAKSVIYTRQGNPAWININGDGSDGPVRADDLFHNGTDLDWVNLDKVAIPQADEQQRLLANLIGFMNQDKKPLPRFWYFPRGEKAVVVMTADDHASPYVAERLEQYKTASPVGCSVSDWECIRSSSYIYPGSVLTAAQANAYTAEGFEIGVHVDTGCNNNTLTELGNIYATQLADFATRFPALPRQDSERTHCVAWSGWAFQPTVKAQNGIRLDTNYYFWPPEWVNNRPSMFTGSGMPMRFADLDGSMIDVYQATTQMTDESEQTYPFTIDTLLDRAVGSEGYYGVFTANMHSDSLNSAGSNAIIASAQARGVPVVSGRQMLEWLDGRNASSFANISWSSNTLSFDVNAHSGARGLQGMLPAHNGSLSLQSLTRAGTPVTFTIETIKGVSYARFPASGGAYVAQYSTDTTPPTVSAVSPTAGATGIAVNTTVTAEFSEAIDPLTLNASSFELRDASNAVVPAAVSYHSATRVATLTPNAALAPSTQYTARLKGGTGGVSDIAGNPLAADFSWSFTTSTSVYNCPCSIWGQSGSGGSPYNDGQPIELGVKFRSSISGYITGIRFYKGVSSAGSYEGKLYSRSGTLLATVAFPGSTSTGWQEALFATPVPISADTTYVASYFSQSGDYVATGGFFANSGVNNPPLRALQDDEDGPNGVYNYSAGFPTSSYNSANYWVDVVFDTTIPGDTTPPVISAVIATPGVDGTTATITWTTNESATSRVDYGTTPDALTQNVSNGVLVTNHSLALTGLSPSTTYYYRVTAVDAAANSTTSPTAPTDPLSFVTTAPDTIPPVISNVSALPGANGSASITWNTDEPATSRVDYGTESNALTLTVSAPVLVTAHSLALSGLAPSTTYYYRVTSVDAAANSATAPAIPAPPLSFITPSASFVDTTTADFNAGTFNNCVVDETIGDGAVRLLASIDENFSGTSLPTGWTYNIWNGTTPPLVSGGLLTVNGNQAYTSATYGPGHSLEFVATFTAHAYQTVGFAGNEPPLNEAPWLQFGTGATGTELYARIRPVGSPFGTGDDMIALGAYLGSPHRYRIDWNTNGVEFFIDGVSVVTRSTTFASSTMHVTVSDYDLDADRVTVDGPQLTPYAGSCSFESRVFDAGAPANWGVLAWTGSTPAGTNLALSYRIGNTSTPDGSWTSFTPVASSGTALAGNSRYIQYRAALTTSDPQATPVIEGVTITYRAVSPPLPSRFYGEIHIDDPVLHVGDLVQVQIGGVNHVITTAITSPVVNTLAYQIDVPGDVSGTPEKEGGAEGDVITFTISSRVVAVAVWHSGDNTQLDFHSTTLSLQPGWNLVSFPLRPASAAVSDVLSPLAGQYDLVYVWHAAAQQWLKYDASAPSYGNTLSTLDPTQGFWIHLTTTGQSLTVYGQVPTTTDISLVSGWNLVGYPSSTARALPGALSDHGVDDFTLVYSYRASDTLDPWKLFDRSATYSNDLTTLTYGWGYWIQATNTSTWHVEYQAP